MRGISRTRKTQTWPVGSLKPNDLGLFDVQGNVYTWCQERYKEYPAGKGDGAEEDKEDELVVTSTDSRVLRGGSFCDPASHVRSAYRDLTVPTDRDVMSVFVWRGLYRLAPLLLYHLPPKAVENERWTFSRSAKCSVGPAGLAGRKARTPCRAISTQRACFGPTDLRPQAHVASAA